MMMMMMMMMPSTNSSSRSCLLKTLLLLAALCGSSSAANNIGRIDAVADIEGVGDGADLNPTKKKVVFASPTSSSAATPQDAPMIDRRRNNRNLNKVVRKVETLEMENDFVGVFQWTEIGSKSAKAAEAEAEIGDDGNCEKEVYCGMTVPAGKTLKLKHDLRCTKYSANRGDEAVAITLEPGAKIECNGYSVVQLNDKVGKASRTECKNDIYHAVSGACGLSWGRVGIKLGSGAIAENCKATGWVHGFSMVATTDDQEKIQNTIVGCDASLNTFGVGIDYVDAPGPYFLNFSMKHSSFSNNYAGMYQDWYYITSRIYFKDVKLNSNLNGNSGLTLFLSERSKVTMEGVEASYNNGYYGQGFYLRFRKIFDEAQDDVPRVIFMGTNSFKYNQGHGLFLLFFGGIKKSEILVSNQSQLNIEGNGWYGLNLGKDKDASLLFEVKKGGTVNACGSEVRDISAVGGPPGLEYEWMGHFTCDSIENGWETSDSGPDCTPCPSCDA